MVAVDLVSVSVDFIGGNDCSSKAYDTSTTGWNGRHADRTTVAGVVGETRLASSCVYDEV